METFLDFFLHLDAHLADFVAQYGMWVYGLLFLIVFAETGLVVTPILPGDSLLFAAGALAAGPAAGVLNIWLVLALLETAAILGDTVNYRVGRFVGPRVFRAEEHTSVWQRLLNRDHLQQAHAFFDRYGGKALVLGQFVPIVRTVVPFVAGCGSMPYREFAIYNVVGVTSWIGLCVGGGYFFGSRQIVKDHFELVIVGIVFVSLLPMLWGYLSGRMKRPSAGESK